MFKDLKPPKPITKPQDIPGWEAMPRPKPQGLGDRVERVAQPIAKIIDKTLGTNIQGCGGCKKRKAWLNKKFTKNQ